jgi:hypothetical protein
MTREQTLDWLATLHADLRTYHATCLALWGRGRRDAWPSLATGDELNRLAEQRMDLAIQYGRLRTAIAAATGGVRHLASFGVDRGELFDIALADSVANAINVRLINDALDGAIRAVGMALGFYEQQRGEDLITRTSLAYWWRRGRGRATRLYAEIKDWLGIIARLKP